MSRAIAMLFLTGCGGVLQVVDLGPTPDELPQVTPPQVTPPQVTPPATPEVTPLPDFAYLTLDLEFELLGQRGGCEMNPTGEVWIDLSSQFFDGPPQVLVQSCAAQMTFAVEPVDAPLLRIYTDEMQFQAFPTVVDYGFSMGPFEMGDLLAGSVTQLWPVLSCVSDTPGFCTPSLPPHLPQPTTLSIELEGPGANPSLGCDVGELVWIELVAANGTSLIATAPCGQLAVFEVVAMEMPTLYVWTDVIWRSPLVTPAFPPSYPGECSEWRSELMQLPSILDGQDLEVVAAMTRYTYESTGLCFLP